MSDLNNKHLPSDIDSLTRKDLVEIYHIHAEEMKAAQKQIAELEKALLSTNKELYVVLCEINSELAENVHPLSESEPDYWDMQTVYDNQVLLKGGAE